jgi:CheY-like chemotaxis protein
MIYLDPKLSRQLEPHLRRVLVLDSNQASARLLSELLRDLGAKEIYNEPSNVLAIAALKKFDPQIVFSDVSGPGLDGLQFIHGLRRSELASRYAPVIVVTAEATAGAILGARNAGAHEFLRKPFTIKDLMRRLDASILRPRDWVEAMNYVGPDRRRFNSGDYAGLRKRQADMPAGERVVQALKILRSAIGALETSPVQALRSMRAQVGDMQKAAYAIPDLKLADAVAVLQRALAPLTADSLRRADIEAATQGLWAFLPADAQAAA